MANSWLLSDPSAVVGTAGSTGGTNAVRLLVQRHTWMLTHAHSYPWKSPKCPSNGRRTNKLQHVDGEGKYTQYMAAQKPLVMMHEKNLESRGIIILNFALGGFLFSQISIINIDFFHNQKTSLTLHNDFVNFTL